MLLRFDPFREMERANPRPITMPLDAYREGDHFTVMVDLPGVDSESIDLTVEKNVLAIRAERNWKPAEGQELLIAERPYGVFSRQLFLGDALELERIEAAYDLGVLTLTIPVAEQEKPRKVPISAGHTSGNGS